jgi:hypothetical protein
LAALAALAETPDRIKKILNGREEYAGDGKFVANMFLAGKPVRVTLDDELAGKSLS